MRTPEIKLEPFIPPVQPPHPADHSVVATAITHKGEAVRLFVRSDLLRSISSMALRTASAARPDWVPSRVTAPEYSAILINSGPPGSVELKLMNLSAPVPLIESFPDGDVLIVNGRCRRHKVGGIDRIYLVIDAQSTCRRQRHTKNCKTFG